jgi:hypothetical protein
VNFLYRLRPLPKTDMACPGAEGARFAIPDVKTNSTLLQTALRADFALLFPERRCIN